jgi:hypothetical protein
MFGWLKSLFGSETAQEIVVPPLPKVKKVVKKVTKPTVKEVSKKPALKTKVNKTPRKQKETVTPIEPVFSSDNTVVESGIVEVKLKKKGGRPKKSNI